MLVFNHNITNQDSTRRSRRRALPLLCLILMTLASCRKEGNEPIPPTTTPEPAASEFPINLGTAGVRSRADASPLESVYDRFGVWTVKCNSQGNLEPVMQHSDLSSYLVLSGKNAENATYWFYDNLQVNTFDQYIKFWDESAQSYTFAAYAPYRLPDGQIADATVDLTTGNIRINDIYGHINTEPVGTNGAYIDWVVAKYQRVQSAAGVAAHDVDLFVDPAGEKPIAIPSFTSTVPLMFHHLYSQVAFKIINLEDKEISGLNCVVEVVKQPDGSGNAAPDSFVTHADYAGSWIMDTSASSLQSELARVENATVGHDEARLFSDKVEIPQGVGSQYFKVTISIPGDEDIVQVFAVPEDWQSGYRYVYTIKFSHAAREVILFSVVVDDWENGGTIDDTQTNW